MRELNDYEKEVYGNTDVLDAPPIDDIVTPPADEVVTPPIDDIVVPPADIVTPPIDEVVVPPALPDAPYKSKKFIEVEDEAALYAKLNSKYGHTNMSPESKVMAYLKAQNPELEDNDIAFLAASDYGIGVAPVDEADLTDEQAMSLRKQEIARKKLTTQANAYFTEQAAQVALEDYDPLELDPDYKSYRTQVAEQKQANEARAEHEADVINQIETTSKNISEITDSVEIELDEGKLAVPVKFKLNEEKQKELADFAKRYTPTQAEYDAFNDPKTGKFDYNGYMESLAPIAFAKDMAKTALRQGLAKDREQFIEKELKNSTLRNNDVSAVADVPFDYIDWYYSNVAGK